VRTEAIFQTHGTRLQRKGKKNRGNQKKKSYKCGFAAEISSINPAFAARTDQTEKKEGLKKAGRTTGDKRKKRKETLAVLASNIRKGDPRKKRQCKRERK